MAGTRFFALARSFWMSIVGIALLAVAMGGGWMGYRATTTEVSEVVRAERGSVIDYVHAEGQVVAPMTNGIAPMNGVVGTLVVPSGKSVKKGDVVMKLEASSLNAHLAQVQVARDSEQLKLKQLISATKSSDLLNQLSVMGNAQSLLAADRITPDVYDSMISNTQQRIDIFIAQFGSEQIRVQQNRVRAAEQVVKAARVMLDQTNIKAARDSIVIYDGKKGDYVSAGKPLFQIFGVNDFTAELFVGESEILRVAAGNTTSVAINALAGKKFEGKVISIDPVGVLGQDGKTRYRVLSSFDAKGERLLSKMSADITINSSERSGVLLVPQQAVTEVDGVAKVKKRKDGNVEIVTVSLGTVYNEKQEITSGLNEGDELLLP